MLSDYFYLYYSITPDQIGFKKVAENLGALKLSGLFIIGGFEVCIHRNNNIIHRLDNSYCNYSLRFIFVFFIQLYQAYLELQRISYFPQQLVTGKKV